MRRYSSAVSSDLTSSSSGSRSASGRSASQPMDAKKATRSSRSTVCGFGSRASSSSSKGARANASRHRPDAYVAGLRSSGSAPNSVVSGPCSVKEPLYGSDRRLGRAAREVPHENEGSAWPQDARDLLEGALVGEPVEGLGGEDGVDRVICERDLLGCTGEGFDLWTERHEQVTHRLGRLHGNHAVEPRDEETCELARARPELEHVRRGGEAGSVHGIGRPTRPAALVVLGPAVKAARGHLPCTTQRHQGT